MDVCVCGCVQMWLFDYNSYFREVFEQGKRALVSFVHFYYKHECKLIFQAKGKLNKKIIQNSSYFELFHNFCHSSRSGYCWSS